ncbi:hypothetical protein GQ457_05G012790 [Hibiscus cannabinus]
MPENPSLYAGAVTGVLDGDRLALASSLVNGRPPDQVSRVVSGPVLERPGSPLAEEVQRDNKKVRNQGGVDADESVTKMDVETDTGTTENSMRSGDLAKEQVRLSTDTTRLSYANVVGKSRSKGGFSSDGLELDPHKVVVLDEDCVVDREGKFPTIKFSKRVHDQIDSTMRNVIIVRLLGRNIGYQSLLNRIHALWKPSGDLQLIDLENNYFLVRVEDPRDYERILTEGPWTIYGSYLTVQPWSRSFSTSEKHPSRVVVWVRLPGLPYRYYSKALFRRIAAIVGEVDICTHDPRSGNGVINQKQSSDNMGVEVSKEADKENLFGPWMVVDSRCRRPPGTRGISRDVGQGMRSALGSRFAVLEDELITPAVEQGAGTEVGEQQGEPVSQGALNEVELHSTQPSRAAVGKKGKATEAGNGSGNKGGTGQGLLATAVVLPMVEGQQVSVVEHTGHSKVHAAVSIFEHGHGKAGSAKIGTGKQVAGKAKGLKENAKQGLKVRKSAEMRTVARLVLSDWIDNMNTQLDRFGMDKDLDPGGNTRVCVNQEGVLEKVPSSRSQAMSETRTGDIETSDRGAASPTFWKYFTAFRREHMPKVVGLFEPRISGRKANRVIAKLGFTHSFRVEAQGFSGGIWLLWDLDVELEILHLSNQFINGRVRWTSGMSWIHFTMVYASPSSTRRRALWSQIESLNPGASVPWFVGGDFNVILHADERRGGSDSHIQGSRPFADFLFQTGLSDMGFRGLPFTWSRGNLYQRLDRFLVNNAWIAQFPRSHVCHLEKNGSDHRPILLCIDEVSRSFHPRPFRYIFAWQDHPTFPDLLKRTWDGDNFLANANLFTKEVKEWNFSVFGDIGKRKKRLLARLKGIDTALAKSHSDSLVSLGHKLRAELEEVMNQEESLWSQKACANWILKGDRNTNFFHASTMARRRANFISGLRIHGTDWCEEQEELRHAALSFYQELFSSANLNGDEYHIRGKFKCVQTKDLDPNRIVCRNFEMASPFFESVALNSSVLLSMRCSSYLLHGALRRDV